MQIIWRYVPVALVIAIPPSLLPLALGASILVRVGQLDYPAALFVVDNALSVAGRQAAGAGQRDGFICSSLIYVVPNHGPSDHTQRDVASDRHPQK